MSGFSDELTGPGRVVLLRVGIGTDVGAIDSPLFADYTFDLVPTADGLGLDERTYATLGGVGGRRPLDYFPERLRPAMADQSVHLDPEFDGFTFGDTARSKRSLISLAAGDLLVFYASLRRWEPDIGFIDGTEMLGIIGWFEVAEAVFAADLTETELADRFGTNAHVRNPVALENQRDRLLLVRGGEGSRLLRRAVRISEVAADRVGKPHVRLLSELLPVFGNIDGRVDLDHRLPLHVPVACVESAADFVRDLEADTTAPPQRPSVPQNVVPISAAGNCASITASSPSQVDVLVEQVLGLPGYVLEGGTVVPPCGQGPVFVRKGGGWVSGAHGLACPECLDVLGGAPPAVTGAELAHQIDRDFDAVFGQFATLRLMLRGIGAEGVERLVEGAEYRFRTGQF